MKRFLGGAAVLLAGTALAAAAYVQWQMAGVSSLTARCEQLSLGMSRAQALSIMGDAPRKDLESFWKGRKTLVINFSTSWLIDPSPSITFDAETDRAQYIVCRDNHRLYPQDCFTSQKP